jgi:hypothetical protein
MMISFFIGLFICAVFGFMIAVVLSAADDERGEDHSHWT